MPIRSAYWPSMRTLIVVACSVLLFEAANGLFDYPLPKVNAPEGVTCERLSKMNQTKILCFTRSKVESLEKMRKRQTVTKEGRVCTKIFNMVQRLQAFEEGNFRYCDPATCLKESRHCRHGEMTPECNLCLGKCWIQYSYPLETPGGLQFRSFPCDPTVCGKEVLCGGFDMKNEKNRHTMNFKAKAK